MTVHTYLLSGWITSCLLSAVARKQRCPPKCRRGTLPGRGVLVNNLMIAWARPGLGCCNVYPEHLIALRSRRIVERASSEAIGVEYGHDLDVKR